MVYCKPTCNIYHDAGKKITFNFFYNCDLRFSLIPRYFACCFLNAADNDRKKIVVGPTDFYIYGTNIHTYISVNRFLCAMHFLENLLKTAIFIDISRIIELQRRPKQPECHWGDWISPLELCKSLGREENFLFIPRQTIGRAKPLLSRYQV